MTDTSAISSEPQHLTEIPKMTDVWLPDVRDPPFYGLANSIKWSKPEV